MMISDEPWKMLYESDVSPYSSLMLEIRKSIDEGKIQLKDSDRVVHYLDMILDSLPELQERAKTIKSERDSLRRNESGLVSRANLLEQKISQHDEELTKGKQNLEHQRRQIIEKRRELEAQLKEASAILEDLVGQKYLLEY